MYEKTIILTVLLLSDVVTTEALPFSIHGDGLLEHIFSAGEITGIVYAVMVGIIGTILSIAFCIKQLTKKTPSPLQTAQPEGADPESSIETRNPVCTSRVSRAIQRIFTSNSFTVLRIEPTTMIHYYIGVW
ncbi:glycophorin-A isoform X3 [Neofelis nebulosa]|uniref:glycophorin-A isoform X3 n=1 Tax=Neofelis nebulosa TaxID=61452 RepID=UPI00272B3518|nr:glycophorin-A isoform X3 [Neofelis nebulosa]